MIMARMMVIVSVAVDVMLMLVMGIVLTLIFVDNDDDDLRHTSSGVTVAMLVVVYNSEVGCYHGSDDTLGTMNTFRTCSNVLTTTTTASSYYYQMTD